MLLGLVTTNFVAAYGTGMSVEKGDVVIMDRNEQNGWIWCRLEKEEVEMYTCVLAAFFLTEPLLAVKMRTASSNVLDVSLRKTGK